MRIQTIRRAAALFALLVLLAVWGTFAQQGQATFSDNLHNTTLDSSHWKVGKLNVVGSVSPTGQGLQFTLSLRNVANFFAETVWLTCRIRGDFSAQIGFQLLDWPANNGIGLGIGVRPQALPLGSTTLHGVTGKQRSTRAAIAELVNLKRNQDSSQPGGGNFYLGEFNGNRTFLTPTGRSSGILRITRVKDKFTAFYWDGRLWVPLGFWSETIKAEDEWLALQLWGFTSSPNIKVTLENFSITAAGLDCP